jgi:hypothetical protein
MKTNPIDMTSLLLQVYNLVLLLQDFNNTDLMKELQKIIKQNEEIISLLKERRETND